MVHKRTIKGGLLIAIEGVHGCGKSTQIELLRQRLTKDRFSPIVTKEVAGTPLADKIYKIAFQEGGEAFENPLVMTLLIAASRASRVNKLIKPIIDDGGIVIADRYEASMLVYQHYCQGINENLVRKLNEYVTQGIHADITFILDVDAQEAHIRRLSKLGLRRKLSGWDAKDEKFHKRSKKGYLKFAKSEPKWIVVNGMKPPQDIADEIYTKTAHLIKLKNGTGNIK